MNSYKGQYKLTVNLPKIDSYYENFLKTALNIQPKLIISGTLGLKLCGIFKEREVGDLDFNLTEPLTEDEVLIFKDFFNLTPTMGKKVYNEDLSKTWDVKKALLNPLLIQFQKYPKIKGNPISWNPNDKTYKIDIFLNGNLSKKEIILIDLLFKDGTKIPCKVAYPPYILSHKAKLAFDPKCPGHTKHYYDIIQNVLGDQNYLDKVNEISNYSVFAYENGFNNPVPF